MPAATRSGTVVDGDKLAQLRHERGWTQEMLAGRAGIGVELVRKLEQRTRQTARISTLSALAQALGAPVSTLLRQPAAETAAVPLKAEKAPSHRTLLRALIFQRHWQRFQTFQAQFQRAARELAAHEDDPELAKLTVSPRQWERWYSGNVKTEPYPPACRVLEYMFGYSIDQLLTPGDAPGQQPGTHANEPETGPRLSGPAPDSLPAVPGIAQIMPQLEDLRTLSERELHSAREREHVYDRLVALLAHWAETMNRREFVRLLGWAASYVAAVPAVPHPGNNAGPPATSRIAVPARIDAAAIEHIEGVLWSAKRQDDLLGPQAALHTVLSQRNVIRWILNDCPMALRARVLSTLASATRIAGWLSFDAGDYQGAWFYYEQARSVAHEARNSALAGYVLSNMSHLATWQGTPRIGIDHAVAAQGWAAQTNDDLLKAYAHQVAARAYASDGQDQAFRALESAESLISVASVSAPSVAHFNGNAQLETDRSLCYLSLDRPGEASSAAKQALEKYDSSFVRNRAFANLYLARAYMNSGEIAVAADTVSSAVDLAMQNRSPRFIRQLRQSFRSFTMWQQVQEVRDLKDRCIFAGIVEAGSPISD